MQMEMFTRVNGHLILPTGWGPKFVFVSFSCFRQFSDSISDRHLSRGLRKGTYHHSDGLKTQRFYLILQQIYVIDVI